jgi:hypothetical protein
MFSTILYNSTNIVNRLYIAMTNSSNILLNMNSIHKKSNTQPYVVDISTLLSTIRSSMRAQVTIGLSLWLI